MTKYILAGGCDRLYPDYGKRLAEVVLREKRGPVILSCMFSQARDDREQRYAYFDEWFRKYFGDGVTILHAQEDSFYEQLKEADVLYLHGGTTKMLLDALPDFNEFRDSVEGKTVVGSSAGANYLAKYCYSPSIDETMEGSGILDIGVVVHYGIEKFDETSYTHDMWLSVANKVRSLAGDRPTVLLSEGNFVVFDS